MRTIPVGDAQPVYDHSCFIQSFKHMPSHTINTLSAGGEQLWRRVRRGERPSAMPVHLVWTAMVLSCEIISVSLWTTVHKTQRVTLFLSLSLSLPPEAVLPHKALHLPTFSHFLIANITSLSLSLSFLSLSI